MVWMVRHKVVGVSAFQPDVIRLKRGTPDLSRPSTHNIYRHRAHGFRVQSSSMSTNKREKAYYHLVDPGGRGKCGSEKQCRLTSFAGDVKAKGDFEVDLLRVHRTRLCER